MSVTLRLWARGNASQVPLTAEGIPYELIGGGAVMVQVQRVSPMLSAIQKTSTSSFRAGVDMLLPPGETKALNAAHLILSGEKVRPNQAIQNPPVRPEYLSVHGVSVAVIAVFDLVQMKLSNNRDSDRVHVRDLDSVSLITRQWKPSFLPGLGNG